MLTSPSAQDSTLEFEKRRNVPVRYSRELMANTLKAMSRIAEIRARREAAFYRARMLKAKGGASVGKERDVLLVHKNRHLQKALGAERERNAKEGEKREKIKVENRRRKSALVAGEGMSM